MQCNVFNARFSTLLQTVLSPSLFQRICLMKIIAYITATQSTTHAFGTKLCRTLTYFATHFSNEFVETDVGQRIPKVLDTSLLFHHWNRLFLVHTPQCPFAQIMIGLLLSPHIQTRNLHSMS